MRLAILGGTGRIGGHLLTQVLDAGHEVHVLARSPQALAPLQEALARAPQSQPVPADAPAPAARLRVLAGDALDAGAVAELVGGSDAVLSALGPRGARSPALLAGAAAGITAGMAAAGVRRLICVSAAGAFITGAPDIGALTKAILPRIFAKPFADVRQMEAVIRASDLDWTLVRATRLVNGPLTGRYRVRPDYPPPGGGKISRADVAHFMAEVLSDGGWLHSAPALGY
jgi:putative NADH-flavin reductase